MNSCYNCTDRHMGCHSECEKYKADCAARAELKAKIAKERITDDYQIHSCIERRAKYAKKRKELSNTSKFSKK